MTETAVHFATMLLLMGLVSLLAVPMRAAFACLSMPDRIGFILFGAALSLASALSGFGADTLQEQSPVLAKIVLVVLLFRVGLESDLGAGLAAAAMLGRRRGGLIGFSKGPRAKIYLLVMIFGLTLGPWAVLQVPFNAAVLASIATCIIWPVVAGWVLRSAPGGAA